MTRAWRRLVESCSKRESRRSRIGVMLECLPLFRGGTVRLDDVVCRSNRCGFSAPEATRRYTVIVPRSGVFVGEIRGQRVLSDANTILFLNPDEPYRVRHPADGGDRCTNICLDEASLRDLLRSVGARMAVKSSLCFEVSHGPNEPAVHVEHRRLLASLARGWSDPLQVEETVLGIARAALASTYRIARLARSGRRDRVALRHRRHVEAARELLATRSTERLQLADVAAQSGCSPYHLCRIFRQHTGATLHQYRNRLRIRAAQERIAQGEKDLTRLALDLGFADHSHFTHVFKGETGESPSGFRAILEA